MQRLDPIIVTVILTVAVLLISSSLVISAPFSVLGKSKRSDSGSRGNDKSSDSKDSSAAAVQIIMPQVSKIGLTYQVVADSVAHLSSMIYLYE